VKLSTSTREDNRNLAKLMVGSLPETQDETMIAGSNNPTIDNHLKVAVSYKSSRLDVV